MSVSKTPTVSANTLGVSLLTKSSSIPPTTKWEKEFIDRTDAKNSLEPMRKQLTLKSLGVYWTSNVSELFGNLAPKYIMQNMKDLILKELPKNPNSKEIVQKDTIINGQKLEYIIAISATCKLIQKNKKDPATASNPEFDISLSLKPLDLQLKKPQLEDVIRLLEFFTKYQKYRVAAIKEREKEIGKLTQEQKDKMRAEFLILFGKVHRDEKAQSLKEEEKLKVVLLDERGS